MRTALPARRQYKLAARAAAAVPPICAEPGCGKTIRARTLSGLCGSHAAQARARRETRSAIAKATMPVKRRSRATAADAAHGALWLAELRALAERARA